VEGVRNDLFFRQALGIGWGPSLRVGMLPSVGAVTDGERLGNHFENRAVRLQADEEVAFQSGLEGDRRPAPEQVDTGDASARTPMIRKHTLDQENFLRGHEAAFLAWNGGPGCCYTTTSRVPCSSAGREGEAIRFPPTVVGITHVSGRYYSR